MSSRPSAFDALMSGARAATAAKKKRKASDSLDPPQNPSPPIINDQESHLLGISEKKPSVSVKLMSNVSELKKKGKEFDSNKVACWNEGERVPFLFLCLGFDMIDAESSRIIITDIVCNMLRTVMNTKPDDLLATVYLMAKKIAPPRERIELGIGNASIIKALSEAFGRTEAQVKKQNKELGDLGLLAKASRSSQSMMRKPDALTIAKVFDTFRLIAKESGKASQDKKKNHIKSLLVAATDCEPLYLIRLLQKNLRIGLAEETLLAALGQAAVYAEKHSTPPAHIQSPLEEMTSCSLE